MQFLAKKKWLLFYFPFFILFLLTLKNALFWDTVYLVGEQGLWFYQHSFQFLWLPSAIDCGHPTAVSMYMAFCWKIFGKSLTVSHIVIQPFVLFLVYQVYSLSNILFQNNEIKAALLSLLILSEAAVLSQCSMVSPDIILLAGFVWTLNTILKKSNWKSIALILLTLANLRGVMVAFSLFLFDIYFTYLNNKNYFKSLKKTVIFNLQYFIGLLPVLIFLVGHWIHYGWIGYNAHSASWGAVYDKASLPVFLYNWGLILHCKLLDYGKAFKALLYVIGLILVYKKYFKNKKEIFTPELKSFIFLSIVLYLIIGVNLAQYSKAMGHRYFMPLTLTMSIVAALIFMNFSSKNYQPLIIIAIVVQLSGNFWRYPRNVYGGWDVTLGHFPFYKMKNEMMNYIHENNINPLKVAARFPLVRPFSESDLNDDERNFSTTDDSSCNYRLYCNIGDNLSDQELKNYYLKYTVLKEMHKGIVDMVLFKIPETKK